MSAVALSVITVLALMWTGIFMSDKPAVWEKFKYKRELEEKKVELNEM